MPSRARPLRLALDIAAIALIALYVVTIAARNAGGQWDFRSYATAAQLALSGGDPYVPENLAAFAGRLTQPFLYPPISLILLLPLALIPATIAGAVWIALKVAVLAALVWVWRRWFLTRSELLPIVLLAAFGWNGAAIWDLRSGNIALIECGVLWTAFACFVSGRRILFASLVVLAACFKLTPAVFLLLLLVPTERQDPDLRLFVISVASLGALVLGSMAGAAMAHWEPFLRHLPPASTLGESNPSSLAFWTSLTGLFLHPEPVAAKVALGVWVVFALALIGFSTPAFRQAWRLRDARRWVMMAVFLFVLVSPRIMAYGFVLLTPAALFLAPRPLDRSFGRIALALLLSVQGLTRAANHPSDIIPMAPIVLTLLLWLLVVSTSSRASAASPTRPQSIVPEPGARAA